MGFQSSSNLNNSAIVAPKNTGVANNFLKLVPMQVSLESLDDKDK